MLMDPAILWTAYAAVVINDHYCYLLQRTALMVCRHANSPEEARFSMLPDWYKTAGPTQLLKWVILVLLFIKVSWIAALLGGILPTFVGPMLPIDHASNLPKFRRHLQGLLGAGDTAVAETLLAAIGEYETEMRRRSHGAT